MPPFSFRRAGPRDSAAAPGPAPPTGPSVGDRDQPQLLAPAAVDRFGDAVHRPGSDGTQEVGVVVDAHDISAPRVARPGEGGDAGHALDHRAIDTAVHQAHRLQQFGLDLELRASAVGAQFGEPQPQFGVERGGEIRRDGRVRRRCTFSCLHHRRLRLAAKLRNGRAPCNEGTGLADRVNRGVAAALRTLPRSSRSTEFSIGKAALILQGLAAYSWGRVAQWIFGDGCRTGQTTVCAAALTANRILWPPGALRHTRPGQFYVRPPVVSGSTLISTLRR